MVANLLEASVVKRLAGVSVQEAIKLYGVSDQVKWLEQELQRMQCFLLDAKRNESETVKNWVREMGDIAFEAENIIDTFMDLKLRRQQPGCMGFMKRFVFIFDELVSRHKVHVDVEGIKTKLQDLLPKSRLFNGIAEIGETIGTTIQSRSSGEIALLSDDIDMVGFDDEKIKIVQELVDINNTTRSVISIVGIGGLGKTTLAKSIYNDHKVKRSFDMFAWVIISQQYTIIEILKRISSKVSATLSEGTIEDLSNVIYGELKERKYLIVLDDVWEEDAWNELLKVFPDVNNGSRVLITTRFENVVNIADSTTKLHKLRCLNKKEAWELFLRMAFPRQNIQTCCPTDLVEYAHQLVQKCRGVSLALVVLGGLISTKPQTKDAWKKVIDNMKWSIVGGEERCLEILALSYNDLPYYLKSCFLYFGCFKEDMNIPPKTLIRMWSTEGFLPTINNKTIEEFGFDCLEELAQRCLIQITEREYDDSVKCCRIHDLLRDLCISEAKENKFLEIYQNDTANCATIQNEALRLIIFNKIETLNNCSSKLRGLFYSQDFIALNGQFGGFKLLRVLFLPRLDVSKFPSEIKSLILLRYLHLEHLDVEEVPSWIGHLRNLQTFILRYGSLKKISNSLWTIGNLRHIYLPRISPNMGNNVSKNLQTLEGLKAGSWIGKTLPKLTNLCELSIHEVSNDHANALSSSLQKLGRLASFSIYDGHEIPVNNIITAFSNQHCLKELSLKGSLNSKQLPPNDVFPQQLVKLVLSESQLEQDPMATLKKLRCLKYLRLGKGSYVGKQMICSPTNFPQLLSLVISCLDELEEWKIEEKTMPCLKSLRIHGCKRLKIPEGLKNVPLCQLSLLGMPEEFVTKIKENTGEDWYKIQHAPNISTSIFLSSFNWDKETYEELAEEMDEEIADPFNYLDEEIDEEIAEEINNI